MSADQNIRALLETETLRGFEILKEYGDNIIGTLRSRRERHELDAAAAPKKDGRFTVDRSAPTRALTRGVQTYAKFLGQMRMDDVLRQKLDQTGRVLETLTPAQYQEEMVLLSKEALQLSGDDELLAELKRRGMLPKVAGMLSPGAMDEEP